MPETDLFLIFVTKLNALGLPYMVTGSVAGVLYGEPRVTHDVDIVLDLSAGPAIRRLTEAFPIAEFYCPPEEILIQEAQRRQRGHFNLIHHGSGFRADVYLANEDAFHEWALEHRRSLSVGDVEVWVAPPEYVIARKLEFFREGGSEKHVRDIRAILRVSGGIVDHDVLNKWVTKLGLQDQWAQCSSAA